MLLTKKMVKKMMKKIRCWSWVCPVQLDHLPPVLLRLTWTGKTVTHHQQHYCQNQHHSLKSTSPAPPTAYHENDQNPAFQVQRWGYHLPHIEALHTKPSGWSFASHCLFTVDMYPSHQQRCKPLHKFSTPIIRTSSSASFLYSNSHKCATLFFLP